jgi:hypothetical protein
MKNYFFLGSELQVAEVKVYKPPEQDNRFIISFFWVLIATRLKVARATVCTACKAIAEIIDCLERTAVLDNFSLTLIAGTSYRLGVRVRQSIV